VTVRSWALVFAVYGVGTVGMMFAVELGRSAFGRVGVLIALAVAVPMFWAAVRLEEVSES